MQTPTFGDMARWTTSARQMGQAKSEMRVLVQEFTSGQKADLPKHLGFDTVRIDEIDETLARISAYDNAAKNVSSILTTQQASLSKIENSRVSLGQAAIGTNANVTETALNIVVESGQVAFKDMVNALNITHAGSSVFAGSASGVSPLPAPAALIADLKAQIDFTQTPAQVSQQIDDYFTDPAGRYEAVHYNGNDGAGTMREVAPGTAVSIGASALDPGLRTVLAETAKLALAGELPTRENRIEMARQTGPKLQTASGVITLKGQIGLHEATVGRARSAMSAERSAVSIERNKRLAADPYETASKLKQIETQLETHFTMLNRMSKLSLVNYLR